MPEWKDTASEGPGRRGAARNLAEKANDAELAGDPETADRLFQDAQRIDPEAVADVEQEEGDRRGAQGPSPDSIPASDEEVAAITREIRPGAAAPSRAHINGPGSGADSQ